MKSTSSLGIISTAFTGENVVPHAYAGGVIDGILNTAMKRDFNALIFTNVWTNAAECSSWLHDAGVAGYVILAPNIHSDLVQSVVATGLPCVATSADSNIVEVPTVDSDNDLGVCLATEHLISLGHRRIAHLAGNMAQTTAIIRRDAFYCVMMRHGLEVPEEYLVECGYDRNIAYDYAIKLLKRPNRPSAIFCANDDIALGAMQAARDLGISVPDQLSLVGYDNTIEGRYHITPLTTIRQPFDDMGRLATNLLLQQIIGQDVEVRTHILPPDLLVRGSTAPCPE